MSSHALTSLLLDSANDNSTDVVTSNSTSTVVNSVTTTLASTTRAIVAQTTTTSSSTGAPLTTTSLPEDESHFIFGFCTILFFVAIALVVKIVYSNRKKYRNLTPSWRLSASRSSGNVPAGFALSRDPFASRTILAREPFGSAHYTAVPPSTNARLASQQQDAFVGNSSAQLEWERQFFDDDAPTNDSNSRLEFRR